MLICFILFRTQLPITERFHITEIRLKIRFHNNKCILICNCAVFQIFQHLSFQFIIIWGIHKNNVKNTFSLKGTQCLQHVHVQQFTIFCQFCKCKIFSDACSSFWILLHKHCIRSPSAQSFDSDPATSGKKIQETAFQKLRLKYIKLYWSHLLTMLVISGSLGSIMTGL